MNMMGWGVFAAVLVFLTWRVVFKGLYAGRFLAVAVVWLGGTIVFQLGPDTIAEFTIWKLSLKRDVAAAKEVRDQLKKLATEAESALREARDAKAEIVQSAQRTD